VKKAIKPPHWGGKLKKGTVFMPTVSRLADWQTFFPRGIIPYITRRGAPGFL
jgi:hypothetical protein